MHLRIMVSRHSAFYSPLIATIAGGFLEDVGLRADYAVLAPGQKSHELIRGGAVHIMQSAVSSNWGPMKAGIKDLPVHFALINRRDGFFLAGRQQSKKPFDWSELEGKTLLADHGAQPMAMLKYGIQFNNANWDNINVLDRGTPAEMMAAFRAGEGDFVHLQAPGPEVLEAEGVGFTRVSVGAFMPEVAFSTLCCSRDFLKTGELPEFLKAYEEAREFVRTADPKRVASIEAKFFEGIAPTALTAAIARYQRLGNWDGSIEITQPLYEQALTVFGESQPFEEVCATVQS
jgi:NitT/TauT family transport system substrate-binding protein